MRFHPLTLSVWRIGIALLLAADAIQIALRAHSGTFVHPEAARASPLFHALAGSSPLLALIALAVLIASIEFGRARHVFAAGLVALAGNRLLVEAYASVTAVYDESFYHAGAATLGWLLGRLFGISLGLDEKRDARQVARYSAIGALAMFAATYVNAGTCKILDSGVGWADTRTIRLMAAAHMKAGAHPWYGPLQQLVVNHPDITLFLSVGTLFIQCGALLFPWNAWTRALWGTLFLCFHGGIHVVSGILFPEPMLLAILFGVPWAGLATRLGLAAPGVVDGSEAGGSPAVRRDAIFKARLAFVAFVAVLLVAPRRDHPIELAYEAASSAPLRALFPWQFFLYVLLVLPWRESLRRLRRLARPALEAAAPSADLTGRFVRSGLGGLGWDRVVIGSMIVTVILWAAPVAASRTWRMFVKTRDAQDLVQLRLAHERATAGPTRPTLDVTIDPALSAGSDVLP